jgi:hypothetical protein
MFPKWLTAVMGDTDKRGTEGEGMTTLRPLAGHTQITTKLAPRRKNQKAHHHTHSTSPPVPILSQFNPIRTPQPNSLRSILSPSTPWFSEWSLSFGLSHQNFVQFSRISHACHIPFPPHSPWFELNNNMWGWLHIMNLLIEQLSPF